MSNTDVNVYVILISDYNKLFQKKTIQIPTNVANNKLHKQMQDIILQLTGNTQYNDEILYRIEDGFEKQCILDAADIQKPWLCFNPSTIAADNILIVRPHIQFSFSGAITSYSGMAQIVATKNVKLIYNKMVEIGLPYYVQAKGDGACFYYAFAYGLFMNALLEDNKGLATQHLNTLINGATEFKNNYKQQLITHDYEEEEINNYFQELTLVQNFVSGIYTNNNNINATIRRLYFDSIINCFPNVMYSLRFAIKCTWLNYFIKANTNQQNSIIAEMNIILPKTAQAEFGITQSLDEIFGNKEGIPIAVQERALGNNTADYINTQFIDLSNNNTLKNSNAHMAYTGGHYDIALNTNFAYNSDDIKQIINAIVTNNSSSSSSSASANNTPQPIDGFDENEQNEQQTAFQTFLTEQKTKFEEAFNKPSLDPSDLELLATEPGISYLGTTDFFTDPNKINDRTALRNYIINKGSPDLVYNLYTVHPNNLQLDKLYSNPPTLLDLTLNAKRAYVVAINPNLINNINTISENELNKLIKEIQNKQQSAPSASPSPSTTNPSANPSAAPATTGQKFNAWAKMDTTDTVLEVVFTKPTGVNVITIDDWKTQQPKQTDQYIGLTFTLATDGLSENLDYTSTIGADETALDAALKVI
jgi:hypothetical protein